ncbi:B3 domain-containing transcription factor VRN1 isoform X2 [Malania oleifera]|uniref:B3 domain-containing transcription factor VRN1 isoform X2 n=1 Tax=Malania oleifera TaxID=397392 RepID=UPI0025AEC7B2|nr:B3 domain-containing transcription factor VRN1 isoform X2 [Malania oleifera]XP_057965091.1 B3 domain-containing transcription factor VRN1 isoform X2 [Malania oleifera]
MAAKVKKKKTPSKNCLSFFKVYIPAHSSERLHIPEGFIANLNGVLPNKTILRDHLGRLWHVEVAIIENVIYFQKGWQRFVKDNTLELGDFLLFRYNGDYIFDFKILGKNGCEKDETRAHMNIEKKILYLKEEEKEEKVQNDLEAGKTLNKQTLGSKGKYSVEGEKKICQKRRCSSACKVKQDSCFEAESSTQIKLGRRNKLAQHSAVPDMGNELTNSTKRADEQNQHQIKDADNVQAADDIGLHSSDDRNLRTESDELQLCGMDEDKIEILDTGTCSALRRSLTSKDGCNAVRAARMFKPKNPFVKVILKPSYINKGNMHVPSTFAGKYLSEVVDFIKLQVSDGRQWHVRCIHKRGIVNKLSKGWSAFVLENGLEEGDVCVFELIKTKEVALKVAIFRAVEMRQ